MKTLQALIDIRNLMDKLLAEDPNQAVQANIYSARMRIVQAIREQSVTDEVRRIA